MRRFGWTLLALLTLLAATAATAYALTPARQLESLARSPAPVRLDGRAGAPLSTPLPGLTVRPAPRAQPTAHAASHTTPFSCGTSNHVGVDTLFPFTRRFSYRFQQFCSRVALVSEAASMTLYDSHGDERSETECRASPGRACGIRHTLHQRVPTVHTAFRVQVRIAAYINNPAYGWALVTRHDREFCRVHARYLLTCSYGQTYLLPEHRCDLSRPVNRRVGAGHSARELYPSSAAPTLFSDPHGNPITDPLGQRIHLRWGRTNRIPGRLGGGGYWSGFGYSHIAAKHGWSRADRRATNLALDTEPDRQPDRRYVYLGARYRRNATSCQRRVIVDPSRAVGILTSYGEVVGQGTGQG